jgi:hypothetical protein
LLDERGFPRYTGTCPQDALVLAPDDLNSNVIVMEEWVEVHYENLETAW